MAFALCIKNVSKIERINRLNRFFFTSKKKNGTRDIFTRDISTEKKMKSVITKNEDEILKSVFVSQSNNIFTNLAIEDWLYRNTDFNRHHVLLIWRNCPTVVVGRHQNPWLESNMGYLAENGIDVARRNSGGEK